MKSKFTKLLATALVLCLVLALLPAAAFAGDTYTVLCRIIKALCRPMVL